MLSLNLIEEIHQKLLRERESKDIDLSKIKTVADIKRAYQIRKIIEDGLKLFNPDVSDFIINRFANYEIKKRIIDKYEKLKKYHQEHRDLPPYYARDVYEMITQTPWLCVKNEFHKLSKNDDNFEEYELEEIQKLEHIKNKYSIRPNNLESKDAQSVINEKDAKKLMDILDLEVIKKYETLSKLRKEFARILEILLGFNYLQSREIVDKLIIKLDRLS